MLQKIFISKFNYNLPHGEFKDLLASVAQDFAEVPDCQWKIWLIDEEKKEGGAIYLFNSQQAVDNFKEGKLVQAVMAHPALSNFDFRVTDIVHGPSVITRAPIMESAVSL